MLNYEAMELVGLATSYFGGLLCVCWSPDGQLVVVGGEDDLVTVWSFQQRRIVARGQGHRSWITVVAFDPYTTTHSPSSAAIGNNSLLTSNGVNSSRADADGDSGCVAQLADHAEDSADHDKDQLRPASRLPPVACYRLGSVAMDTQLCLWELTDDVLKQQPYGCSRSRTSMVSGVGAGAVSSSSPSNTTTRGHHQQPTSSLTQRLANLSFSDRTKTSSSSSSSSERGFNTDNHHQQQQQQSEKQNHRRSFSLTSRSSPAERLASSMGKGGGGGGSPSPHLNCSDPLRLIGTASCPRLDEAPLLEPLVCKKIAHERLTSLIFREDCLITACQDGVVCTWARPNLPHLNSTNEGTMV